jgi:hypothetical protein
MRAALDVLDLAREMWATMPSYVPEKPEFDSRIRTLAEVCVRLIKEKRNES